MLVLDLSEAHTVGVPLNGSIMANHTSMNARSVVNHAASRESPTHLPEENYNGFRWEPSRPRGTLSLRYGDGSFK